jgi:hypothetical protein
MALPTQIFWERGTGASSVIGVRSLRWTRIAVGRPAFACSNAAPFLLFADATQRGVSDGASA